MAEFVQRIRQAAHTNCGLMINCDITNGVLTEDWPVVDLEDIYRLVA